MSNFVKSFLILGSIRTIWLYMFSFCQDPVIEMVNDGDFLDHLPPDWRDSFDMEPSTSTSRSASRTQAREEKGDTMQVQLKSKLFIH